MEKWKIVVIAGLLGFLPAYGLLKEKIKLPVPVLAPRQNAAQPIRAGSLLAPWRIESAEHWMNTEKPQTLEGLRGKFTLVDVFRTGCSHCRALTPILLSMEGQYRDRGLQVVGIHSAGEYADPDNPENNVDTTFQWVRDHGITFPVAFDEGSEYYQKTLRGSLYPATIILDPNGRVVFQQTGHSPDKGIIMIAELEKHLPGPGDLAQRARQIAAWLSPFPEYATTELKELERNIRFRLKDALNTSAKAPPSSTQPRNASAAASGGR